MILIFLESKNKQLEEKSFTEQEPVISQSNELLNNDALLSLEKS